MLDGLIIHAAEGGEQETETDAAQSESGTIRGPWHSLSDKKIARLIAPRPTLWRQILMVTPPSTWEAKVLAYRRKEEGEDFQAHPAAGSGSGHARRKAASAAIGALQASSSIGENGQPTGLGDGSRVVVRVRLGVLRKMRSMGSLSLEPSGESSSPSRGSGLLSAEQDLTGGIEHLAIDHAGLGLSEDSIGSTESRTRTRGAGDSAEEPVGGNIEIGGLSILPYVLQPLVAKSAPAAAHGQGRSLAATSTSSSSSSAAAVSAGSVESDSSTAGRGGTGKGSEQTGPVAAEGLQLTDPLPRDYLVACTSGAIVDDAPGTSRMFNESRPVAVGCVVAASRIYNRMFPEACKPVRIAFDLVSLGESLGIAYFLQSGGFVVTCPGIFFSSHFLDLGQKGLRQNAFLQRLAQVQFDVLVERTGDDSSGDGQAATSRADSGTTTTRVVAAHPLFLRQKPWYLPFITYRSGLRCEPSRLFSLHSLATAEGMMEAIGGGEGSREEETDGATVAELQALAQKAQIAGRKAAASHAEELVEAEERLEDAMHAAVAAGSSRGSGDQEDDDEDEEEEQQEEEDASGGEGGSTSKSRSSSSSSSSRKGKAR